LEDQYGTELTKTSGELVRSGVRGTVCCEQVVDSQLLAGELNAKGSWPGAGDAEDYLDVVEDWAGKIWRSIRSCWPASITWCASGAGACTNQASTTQLHVLRLLRDQVANLAWSITHPATIRVQERAFSIRNLSLCDWRAAADEFTHSWNGRKVSPACGARDTELSGLRLKGDLLWVIRGTGGSSYLGRR